MSTTPSRLVKAKKDASHHYHRMRMADCERARECRRNREYSPLPGINVVAVGVGERETKGRFTGRLCLKVFVAKKFPKSRVRKCDCLPASVDVVEVGYPVCRAPVRRKRRRPVQPGTSVSPQDDLWDLAGTFGLVVTARNNRKKRFILSNNHVLVDENRIKTGTRILQPGSLDKGKKKDGVAKLSAYVPLKFDNARNWMDAAIARIDSKTKVDRTILGIGVPRSGGTARRNARVRKSGRTTGVTRGIVRETKIDVLDMGFFNGDVRMDDVIGIQGIGGVFSREGDSGSAIVDENDRVIGLLFGGTDVRDYAIPIGRILRRFKVRIAP